MNIKTNIKQLITTLYNSMKERKKWILALSCLVVFCTTYLLILPAFTLDKEEASEQGGVDVPGVEQSAEAGETTEDLASEDNEKEESAEASSEDVKKEETAKPDSEKQEKSSKTETSKSDAKKKSADITLENDESDGFSVAVESKEAVLSEDMSVAVREIDKSDKKQKKEYDSLYNDALEAVQKAQEEEGQEKPSDFAFAKFYDISLMDGETEVEPDAAVDVKISFSKDLQKELKVADPERVHIVHFAVDKESGEVTPEVLGADTADITVKNNKVTEAAFTADSFSVFAVVYSTIEKTFISASGDTYEVTVKYDESAEIPEDAELVVREIIADSEEYSENNDLVNKKLAAKNESDVSNPSQFDISIISDGKVVEPKEGSNVKVEIKLAQTKNASEEDDNDSEDEKSNEEGAILYNGEEIKELDEDTTSKYVLAHIHDDGKAEIIEDFDVSSDDDNNLVFEFETDSFSSYLVDTGNDDTLGNLPNRMYVGDVIYLYQHSNYTVNTNGVVDDTSINNNGDYRIIKTKNTGRFSITRPPRWWGDNEETKWIEVLPERNDTHPDTIETINNADIGLSLNLFDYDTEDVLDDYFNQFNHTNYPYNNYFKNYGINNNHAFKFWGSGIGNWGSYSGTGVKLAYNQFDAYGVSGIVKQQLAGGTGGYPELKDGEETLAYLFDPRANTPDRDVYQGADGLFKKDGDYYVYDSTQNYAWYNPSTNRFEVYNGTYEQKSDRERTQSTNGKSIGFFPFHKWDNDYDLYVNYNKHLNHHFGMSMKVDFAMPGDPKAVKDSEGNDIVFEFSGDDDLWVFIDGKLAMDIGGVHQPTAGTINFTTGKVTLKTGEHLDQESTQMTQQQFNSRFPDIYNGNNHTLQVFYIERGGCDSNCMIKFNLTRYGHIHFDKADDDNPSDKLAGAVFGIYKDADCTIPLMENLKYGTPASRAYVEESDAQGHVQFSDIPLGTYYLRELHAPDGYPLDKTVHTVEVYIDQKTGQVKVEVTIDGVAVSDGVTITNKKPDPITLGLHKEWQNNDGDSIVAPEGVEATFEIKRLRTYETYTEQEIQGQGSESSHLTVGTLHNGEYHVYAEYDLIANTQATISWSYNNDYEGAVGYEENGIQHTKTSNPSNTYSQAITMPAANGSATFYVIDNSDNGEAISKINVGGSQFYGNSGGGVIHNFTTVTEPDPDFHYTGDTQHVTNNQVTLPINTNTWTYDFNELPIFGSGEIEDEEHKVHKVAFHYSYYLEEVSSTAPDGTTVVYKDLNGNVINSAPDAETSTSGTETVTNKVPTGYLRIDKEVTYNGVSPVPDGKKSDLAGEYTFKVFTDSNCSKPYKVIQGEAPNQQEIALELTVTIGNDGAGKTSETVKLPIGDYWIEEQTPSQTGVTPEENRIHVIVKAEQTTEKPAVASFTNNKEESNNPDELAIELEKTFIGLPNASKIPGDYQAALTYTYQGKTVTVPLTGSTQGNVTCTKKNNDMTWHWRVIRIPKTATNFAVYESNYDITGYTRITKINGNEVANPGEPQAVEVLVPAITMTNISRDYTTSDSYKVFEVKDNQILLVRMTSQATVVVSPKSLSLATREAIENMITGNDNKIPGDNAQANWWTTFLYFSKEIQGDSFAYGGRTIYFDGDLVKIPKNASNQEVRVDINYTSSSAENSFTIENKYTDNPTEVDVLKVEKGKETTTKLPGATFELRKLEDVAPAEPGGTLTYVKDDNQKVIVTSETTGDDGRLTFTGLTYGVYEIREVTPPPGYIMEEEVVFYLRVDGGAISYIQKENKKPSEWSAASSTDATVVFTDKQDTVEPPINATFRVSNTPGKELPHTGGIGTTIFYIAGTILVLGCGIYFARKRIIN